MLQSGEITMTPWTRGASFHLEGQPIAVSFDGAIASYENWTVPKDAPHADAAMKFIDFAMKPEPASRLDQIRRLRPHQCKGLAGSETPTRRRGWPPIRSITTRKSSSTAIGGDGILAKVSEKWDEWRLSK